MDIKVLVPIAQGSEELEAITIIDLLRRAGMNVIIAGENQIVTCSRGTKIIPDKIIYHLDKNELFDAIILPGGSEGTLNLMQNERLFEILQYNIENEKIIGAICAAPSILAFHKFLDNGIRLTSHPSIKSQLEKFDYQDESVVVDGNLVTSRGAGTAIEFSLKLIELLAGFEIANKVAQGIVYHPLKID